MIMAVQGDKKLSVSIYDYPEHLNPFREDDHKLHFWNITKGKLRRNSFSDGFKEFKRTWSFKSFTKKGRKNSMASDTASVTSDIPESPIMYRSPARASTMSRSTTNPGESNRYNYGGSTTPLPRFRFQERGSLSDSKSNGTIPPTTPDSIHSNEPPKSPSDNTSPVIHDITSIHRGSVTSLQSNNPFDGSVGSVRVSTRKKRRAPLPPQMTPIHDTPSITVTDTTLNTTVIEEKGKIIENNVATNNTDDIDIDDPSLNIELKIVEDVDEIKHSSKHTEISMELDKKSVEISMEVDKKSIENEKESINDVEEIKVPDKNVKDLKPDNEHNQTHSERSISKDNVDNESATDKLETNVSTLDQNDTKANDHVKDEKINHCEDVPNNDTSYEDIIPPSEVEYIVGSIATEQDGDDVFKKVDIVTYKKQPSVDGDNDVLKETNKEFKLITSTNNGTNEEGEIKNDTSEVIESPSPVVVKYGYIGRPDTTDIIKENARRRSQFFEMDKNSQESENIETREKSSTQENGGYQRRRVSDMKLLFDNPNVNDPSLVNPIPKPRRARSTSKSTSGNSSPEHDISKS